MKTYKVKIKFVTDYLQARFTEDAKAEIEKFISQGIAKTKEDSWAALMYFDESGIYIPAIQIRNSLVAAGKEFKIKKQRRSMQQWVISNLIVTPDCLFLGKQSPDKILTSYPARKDGNRVTIKHPAFNAGLEVEFVIKSLDDEMEPEAIENLVKMSGKMYGLGARRRDMFGRFEVTNFKEEYLNLGSV